MPYITTTTDTAKQIAHAAGLCCCGKRNATDASWQEWEGNLDASTREALLAAGAGIYDTADEYLAALPPDSQLEQTEA